MMRRIPLAATGLAAALFASDAAAKCAMPGVRFEPASGALPSAPVLRLFLPPYWAPTAPAVTAIDASGKKLNAAMTAESTAPAFTTYRVTLGAVAKGTLHVRFVDKNGTAHDASYSVDPGWRAPLVTPPKIALGAVHTAWTCSHQATRNLRFPSVAPAYRVTFAPTVGALAKSTSSVVLPADPNALWGSTASVTTADLALGHVNCMGHTYEWKGGQWARVHALFPDGSEAEVAAALWLDPP